MDTYAKHAILTILLIIITMAMGACAGKHEISSLRMAINRTACPFFVQEDFNEERVPQLVKHIVCDPKGKCACRQGFSCTQLMDRITVAAPDDPDNIWLLDVKIGCVCMRTASKPTRIHNAPVL